MSYSTDLRRAVLGYLEKGGGKTAAARLFGVSRATIYSWVSRGERLEARRPGPARGRGWKLDRGELLRWCAAQPDWTLKEYATALGVSHNAVWHAFRTLRVSRKKNAGLRGTQRGQTKGVSASAGALPPTRRGVGVRG
ncbi:MAG: helix-turn-helix domain-containing protein [Candidatus Competibacteraceae bacterium]|nr:helix-turn-helix domain-containing protein [Candidatus Competibacteraceae bacterium]